MRSLFLTLSLALALSICPFLAAQPDPNFRVSVTNDSGAVGDEVDLDFRFTNAEDITGWSWSACHTDAVSIEDEDSVLTSTVFDDLDTLFDSVEVVDGGFTVAALLEIDPQAYLDAGAGQLMYTVSYDLDAEGVGIITICEELDDVTPTFADGNGLEVLPTTQSGSIQIDGDSAFKFRVSSTMVPYEPDFPEDVSFSTEVSILENDENDDFPQDVQGFKFGVAHDADLLSVTDVSIGNTELYDMNDGDGPVFFGPNLSPALGDGFTIGCVFDFVGDELMVFDIEKSVVEVTYDVDGDSLEDNISGAQTILLFDETLGSPTVINAIVVDGVESDDVAGYGAIITFGIGGDILFKRGDVDGDGTVTALTDALFGLDWIFGEGEDPPCLDAVDFNDDGIVHVLVDTLSLLWYGFGEGPPPAAPGTVVCGFDTTVDSLTCLEGDDCI